MGPRKKKRGEMGNPPHILGGDYPRPRPKRWPWFVIALVAAASVACCVGYLTGAESSQTMQLVTLGVIVVTGIIAGIKYGEQKKKYWA